MAREHPHELNEEDVSDEHLTTTAPLVAAAAQQYRIVGVDRALLLQYLQEIKIRNQMVRINYS